MGVSRRSILAASGAALAAPLVLSDARAQAWPSRPIRLVIPFPPGGAQDNVGRLAALKLQEKLGQQVIADNRPGASGALAADIVKNSPPDGYTVLLGNISSHTVNPHTLKISYDPFADFIPVAGVGAQPNLLCANPDFPHDTIAKLVAAAKKEPGKFHYGSSGTSTSPSLSMALFKLKADVDLTLTAYKGAAPASTDAMAGHIQLVIANYDSLRALSQQGKLKPIAVTGAKRSPTLPNVPTFAESGYPDVVVNAWAMLFVPAGTPADIVGKMHGTMNAALDDKDLVERFDTMGVATMKMKPDELTPFIRAEHKRWGEVIRAAGIKAD